MKHEIITFLSTIQFYYFGPIDEARYFVFLLMVDLMIIGERRRLLIRALMFAKIDCNHTFSQCQKYLAIGLQL